MPRLAIEGRQGEVKDETNQVQRDRAEPKMRVIGEKRGKGARD